MAAYKLLVPAYNPCSSEMYAGLMMEAKARLRAISASLKFASENEGKPDAIFQAEFCFFQIRFVCEVMAHTSLAAHQPTRLTNKLL